ncbi:MAG: HlyC/CorC family transporter [Alphaproteobacteria bacterium]|jgi:magnesium and cobalt transporter|nr:HlyC/CorC family transporter [Alphaproteobacteria bacterium]MDG2466977.1 hemolysin family protein [Alphaproteobacteria bacterium]
MTPTHSSKTGFWKKIRYGLKKLLPGSSSPLAREEITELLEESIRDTIHFDTHESTLLRNMLGLRDINALDVMVPRADIFYVDQSDSMEQIIEKMTAASHSRVPVVNENLDRVEGILHIKDLLRMMQTNEKVNISTLLRQPIFISPTMRLLDLLQEMRLRRLHLALVVDEYGGTDGLITIEDLVEEIIGEINDEHDEDTTPLFDIANDGTAMADARLEIEMLEAVTGSLLDEDNQDEIDTVGGLVISLAGRVPGRGEIVRHPSGLEFEIIESDPRHVSMVKIRRLTKSAEKPVL